MDNLRKTIDVLFRDTDYENVLKRHFGICHKYNTEFDKEDFSNILKSSYNSRNYDEIDAISNIMGSSWVVPNEDECPMNGGNFNSIFNVLTKFNTETLIEEEAEPKCQFDRLLRWRDMSLNLGEDIFTTSFLAKKDIETSKHRTSFSWHPVIKTDNRIIDQILKKGTTELHSHLFGSSFHFDLSWLSLMNNISNRQQDFDKIKSYKKQQQIINKKSKNHDIYFGIIKATAIRAFIYCKLIDNNILDSSADESLITKILKSESLSDIKMHMSSLQKLLSLLILERRNKIWDKNIDYAIYSVENKDYEANEGCKYIGNIVLSGERWFMYNTLKEIYSSGENAKLFSPLLYSYLIIKSKFRSEFIQNNDQIGFGNFQSYQNRKDIFIKEGSIYKKLMCNMAINNSLTRGYVNYIETRIKPSNSDVNNIKMLRNIDKAVVDKQFIQSQSTCVTCNSKFIHCNNKFKLCGKDNNEKLNLDDCSFRFHYIYHFIKTGENAEHLKYEKRNSLCRAEIKKQAMSISRMRSNSSYARNRIVGIDAASSELDCRPEVFAQAYRYLKEYNKDSDIKYFKNYTLPKLGFTFHAGEDFFDIADGLRSIDDTIRFLNFSRGDRIGHALALGVDAEMFYKMKNQTIILSRQDLLDNMAWLMDCVNRYNIDASKSLLYELQKCYDENVIFIFKGRHNDELITDKVTFFKSYCLRGDAPRLYKRDDVENISNVTFWDRVGLNQNKSAFLARQDDNARKLYYHYHYNDEVKFRGRRYTEFKVPEDYYQLISDIQQKMRLEISCIGISIETNPSSNQLIGFYKYYDKHPIFKFFNTGLTYLSDELCDNPQIPVSINTDDSGVFATSIENEYALLAIALHKKKSNDGKINSNDRYIYDWLERIRVMGHEQKFKE